MSNWTHVRGLVELDTMARTTPEARFIAETAVAHLPRITGSEGSAEIYIIPCAGNNCSSNCDENGRRTNLGNPLYHGLFETQTKVLIAIKADLRDRDFQTTLRETTKMLNRLASKLYIESCLLRVSDDFGRSFKFDDPEYLNELIRYQDDEIT